MAHTLNNESSAASIFAYKVVVFFEKIVTAMAKRREARATFKTLQGLTDRELNDIGISRGDIRSIANDTWEDNQRRDNVRMNPNMRGFV
jgi:uncharacterized protein YjiS (DUF1127 family)